MLLFGSESMLERPPVSSAKIFLRFAMYRYTHMFSFRELVRRLLLVTVSINKL